MIVRQTILIEAYCDSCHDGMLLPMMDAGFIKWKSLSEMEGQTFKCNCGHDNVLEAGFIIIPTQSVIACASDISKLKTDDSIKRFMEKE